MLVTFISECHKNSLKLTRQILDSYAHRIGQRTWQTVITEQGLQAVRARLSKTARKTTSVACHRIHGTKRSKLLWIVGNRIPFDDTGNVSVNYTQRDILNLNDENDWNHLAALQAIVAIAGLFHDFGKAWEPFQKNLTKGTKQRKVPVDPWRHEWVSVLLFLALVDDRSDEAWLKELAGMNSWTPEKLRILSDETIERASKLSLEDYPVSRNASSLVQWIVWIVLSHHRLPDIGDVTILLTESRISKEYSCRSGYTKQNSVPFDSSSHWVFKHGLPFLSIPWCQSAARWGRKLAAILDTQNTTGIAGLESCQRILLTLSRTALMLGDHEYSSKNESPTWKSDYQPYANSYSKFRPVSSANMTLRNVGDVRQKLDEHLVEVTAAAVLSVRLLPRIESSMGTVQDNRPLCKPSKDSKFKWQNKAVETLREWHVASSKEKTGFFAVNMASTGTGKTFANAKIMNAISPNGLRFTLALGLRTLTLQTGDEYKSKLQLDPTELAILIGSAAVKTLHDQRPESNTTLASGLETNVLADTGSESSEELDWDLDFAYEDLIPDDAISTIVAKPKSRQLLKAPILVCTIDHLMPAVESTRGGKQILPLLRLLSSDLVIDEVDDFDHLDMPAIARLVHLAGMLGRRVMISSATIPPSVAGGLYHAYRSGYQQFAIFRNRPLRITGFWVDEYKAIISESNEESTFQTNHTKFVERRCEKLKSQVSATRTASVIKFPNRGTKEELVNRDRVWFDGLVDSACDLHTRHGFRDEPTNKQVSFGIIRIANVLPCVELSKYLLLRDLPEDFDLRVITYHARQVMLVRSHQEAYLDNVLNRKSGRTPLSDATIRRHLIESSKSNVLFIVVASPVAEVGRDHDYDWAVIEPSSMRSIIQMAGRVRRHRDTPSEDAGPNIAIANSNYRAFIRGETIVFTRPGFEGGERTRGGGYILKSKNILELLDVDSLLDRVDSTPRIWEPRQLQPELNLAHLEHQVLHNVFYSNQLGPAGVRGWTESGLYLSSACQKRSPFRQSSTEMLFKLFADQDDELYFCEVDQKYGRLDYPSPKSTSRIKIHSLGETRSKRVWFPVECLSLIQEQEDRLNRSRFSVCDSFGEIRILDPGHSKSFRWYPEIGLELID
jgi:CRISPR-associated endonuclease/helicase Cas3